VPQDVFIEGAYAWTQVGTVTPLNVGWTTFSNTITIAPTDYLKERIVPLVTVPPLSPPAASDVLLIWARRSGTNLADTYSTNKVLPGNNSSNLCIVSFDCHIYKSRSGTQGEFA
jgi:hypothetical protein